MINKVTIPNDAELLVVSMKENDDVVRFISDLKDSLDRFKLVSVDSEMQSINFSCSFIDTNGKEMTKSYRINYGNKVLIRNRKIVDTDCSSLLFHKVLILK